MKIVIEGAGEVGLSRESGFESLFSESGSAVTLGWEGVTGG